MTEIEKMTNNSLLMSLPKQGTCKRAQQWTFIQNHTVLFSVFSLPNSFLQFLHFFCILPSFSYSSYHFIFLYSILLLSMPHLFPVFLFALTTYQTVNVCFTVISFLFDPTLTAVHSDFKTRSHKRSGQFTSSQHLNKIQLSAGHLCISFTQSHAFTPKTKAINCHACVSKGYLQVILGDDISQSQRSHGGLRLTAAMPWCSVWPKTMFF